MLSRGCRLLSAVLSVALLLGVAPTAVAAPRGVPTKQPSSPSASAAPATADTPLGADVTRPDMLSASVTARAQGVRVEVLSLRTETTRVWVLPSGRVETEQAAGPVRYKDSAATATQGWRQIDTTLVKGTGGVWQAAAVPGHVRVGGGSLVDAVDATGVGVGLSWPGVSLPSPTVSGSTATFANVIDGVDAQVQVRPAGFELTWIVNTQAGLAGLIHRYGSSGSVGLALTTTLHGGVTPQAAADGGVAYVNGKGKVVGRFAAPVSWDSQGVHPGERGAGHRIGFTVGKKATAGAATASLQVNTDQSWLSGSGRVFPIVIDPSYASATEDAAFDTFVEQGYSTDQSSSAQLKLGNNGSGQVARSYLNFAAVLFQGKTITSASLSLDETSSWSCTARSWTAYDAGLASTSTTWTAQPTIGTQRASSTMTKGYSSSCAAGRVTIDMTAQAQAWSSAGGSQVGMMLRATDETDPYGWKIFASANSAYPPIVTVSYDRAPAGLGVPQVSNGTLLNGAMYLSSLIPVLSGVLPYDADGNTEMLQFARFANDTTLTPSSTLCTTTYGAVGSTMSCASGSLPANSQMWIRARAFDSMLYGAWGSVLTVVTATAAPDTPTISCPSPYTDGSWTTTLPSDRVACTATFTASSGSSYSAPVSSTVTVDGVSSTTALSSQPTPSSPRTETVSVDKTSGHHTISVYGSSPTGTRSATASYGFGYGTVTFTSPQTPAAGVAPVTTTDTVQVSVSGPPSYQGNSVSAAVMTWRVAGTTDDDAGWTGLPSGMSAPTLTGATFSGLLDTTGFVGHSDGSQVTVPSRVATLIDLRVCYTYGSAALCATSQVLRVPHAFGDALPTAAAGPGQVALWTGEFQLSATDASLGTPSGDLSISRTHSTFAGAASPQDSVFGPGWTASLDGSGNGPSGDDLIDNTTVDGSLVFATADGDTLVYQPASGARRSSNSFATSWVPADTDTAASGYTIKVTADATVTLTDEDGVVTTFVPVDPSKVTGAPVTFEAAGVADPAEPGKTTYDYGTVGSVSVVSRITAAIQPGVDCSPQTHAPSTNPLFIQGETTGTAAPAGCRWLELWYSETSNGPRVAEITASANGTTKAMATYTYNAAGQLTGVTDARTGLTTTYTWTTSGGDPALAGLTPPGQAPYTFTYTGGRLFSVTRPIPGGGTSQLAAFAYNVGLDQITDLGNVATRFNAYGLPRTATTAFAVFGPDQVITGPPAASNQAWRHAQLQLTDPQGYTINTASYGAGAWQWTASVYDAYDNVIQSWDQRAIAWIASCLNNCDITGASTQTIYNTSSDLAADGVTPLAAPGTVVMATIAPTRDMATPDKTSTIPLRVETTTSYDQGAPNNGINTTTGLPYQLPTRVQTTAINPGDGTLNHVISTVWTGYAAAGPGDADGWALGQATSTTTDMNGNAVKDAADLTRTTSYDTQGRTVKTWQPASDGSDAGTRRTVYWTADDSAPVAACRDNAAFAGLVCQVGPAAQPAGQSLPVTTTTYTWDAQPAQVVEQSGSTSRTTTTTYDPHTDRPVAVSTSTTNLSGSSPVPEVTTTYDQATGQVTGTSSTAGSTTTGHDSWGRTTTYTLTTSGGSDTTTTTYNALGEVDTVSDPNGSTAYTYAGTDANGATETRQLLTQVAVTGSNGLTYTSTAAYDPTGALTTEALPGGIIRRTQYDTTGQEIGLTVNGPVTDTTGTLQPNQPWVGWSTRYDDHSTISNEWTPDPADPGYTGTLGATATASDRTYTYDQAGRLTQVLDRTNDQTGTSTGCATRQYGYDTNGNRTSQTLIPAPTDGTCATSGGTTSSRAYDTADRPTTAADGTGSYVYDALGRQTSIPAADTPTPSLGAITLAYTDTDAASSITQDDTTETYSLDVAGRRSSQTTTTGGTTTDTLIRHYTDSSDDPTWSVDTSGGTTTTTRYADLIDGSLGLTLTTASGTTTAQLAISTPRGDTASTITLPTGVTTPTAATGMGLDTWTNYTEYGQPQQPPTTTPGGITGIGYGWLGAKTRTTTPIGLTLMGARLYNPTTGLFTSPDPIYHGNQTSYGYPDDPINHTDTSGQHWWTAAGHFLHEVHYQATRLAAAPPYAIYCASYEVAKRLNRRADRSWSQNSWWAIYNRTARPILGHTQVAYLSVDMALDNYKARHFRDLGVHESAYDEGGPGCANPFHPVGGCWNVNYLPGAWQKGRRVGYDLAF